MADIKRLSYFTSQFLVEKDFKDEQAYHVGMRRRHNQLLHTWGIADGGLQVKKNSDKSVEIGSGMAIDNDGREIVLLGPRTVDFSASNAEVYVSIEYKDVQDPEDAYTVADVVVNYIRTTERPLVESTTRVPKNDGSVILLAKVKLDASGNIGSVDTSVRKLAGPVIDPGTDLALGSLQLSGELRVTGDASISGRVGIGTTNPQHQLDVVSSNGIKLSLEGNGGGQLILGSNKNDNKIFLEALNAKGDGHAAEILLTGRSAANVPQLSLMADKTFINGNVGIGTATPSATLDVVGSIRSTMWNVITVLDKVPGPLPLDRQFTSNGGTLLLFASGGGYGSADNSEIGMDVVIDDAAVARASAFSYSVFAHNFFSTPAVVVRPPIGAGQHTISLRPFPNTSTASGFEFFTVTILELPWT